MTTATVCLLSPGAIFVFADSSVMVSLAVSVGIDAQDPVVTLKLKSRITINVSFFGEMIFCDFIKAQCSSTFDWFSKCTFTVMLSDH